MAVLALAALALGACGADEPAQPQVEGRGCEGQERNIGAFDAGRACRDVRRMVAFGPRPAGSAANERQARYLAGRLEEAGVRDVGIQKPWRNVVGRIPGTEDGAIVIGAHVDTKDIDGFVGANDGASGAAVVLELARSVQAPFDGPELRFALFDAEEARGDRDFDDDGLRGSRQYVAQAAEGRGQGGDLGDVRAMVLFDMVGDCSLQIPRERNSDSELYGAFAGRPFGGETGPIGDDHIPFLEREIPAVDLIDFTYGSDDSPGPFWHTTQDTLDKVCRSSLDEVGEAAIRALPRLAEVAARPR
ncbi:MAG: M28 family metallopeptidase [Solirubrobacterales bacterium]